MMRLEYGRLMRGIKYRPAYGDEAARFYLQLIDSDYIMHVYQAPTIDGILKKLRADKHRIFGKDVLDYALPPDTAMEYMLFEAELKRRGMSDAEIAILFSLDIEKIKALKSAGVVGIDERDE